MTTHPARAGQAAVTRRLGRQDWLDLARGLAVVSMIVAHTSPWGGLWNVSEYLTAPLFAFLVGASLALAWSRSDRRYGFFVVANVLRGLVLVVLGEALQALYFPIIVVLQTLGVLTIVLAPLVPLMVRRWWIAYAVALGAAILSPLVREPLILWSTSGRHPGLVEWLVEVLATGHAYRVTAFLALGAAGGGLVGSVGLLLRRPDPRVRGALPAVLLLLASAATYALGRATVGADPYSGTTPEIVGAMLLSASVTTGCWWLTGTLGADRSAVWLGPLVSTGRMALSAYTLQILALAGLVRLGVIGSDDHWAVMFGLIAVCVLFCWWWLRAVPTGPVEVVLRLPARALATVWPAQSTP